MSFITLEDTAEAMATMALNKDVLNSRRTYLLTQSRYYTMPELGAIITKVTRHEIGVIIQLALKNSVEFCG